MLISACGMWRRCWLTACTSTIHITSTILSDPVKIGVPKSEDETHLRWLFPSISNVSDEPNENHESVKLAKLSDIEAGALGSQSRAILYDSNSVWSTRFRHDAELPTMKLFSRYEVTCPSASQSMPPLSPLRSTPLTNPSTSSSSMAWVLELVTTLRSSMITIPWWSIPVLSISNAGPLTGSLISVESNCRSMLSRATMPCWS